MRLSPHVWGIGIGLAAGRALRCLAPPYPHADNVPQLPLVEYDVGENPLRESILQNRSSPVDGFIDVPEAPGSASRSIGRRWSAMAFD